MKTEHTAFYQRDERSFTYLAHKIGGWEKRETPEPEKEADKENKALKSMDKDDEEDDNTRKDSVSRSLKTLWLSGVCIKQRSRPQGSACKTESMDCGYSI